MSNAIDEELIKSGERTFLVVVDDTQEMIKAVRFACRRAYHSGGRVAMLYIIEPADFQHWMAVGDLIQEEAREKAEERLETIAGYIREHTGQEPARFIREGRAKDELIALMNEEPGISILVLAAGEGSDGPGPLVTGLTVGDTLARLRIPLTLVPASLSDAEIDALS